MAYICYSVAFTSVWCFFAGAASILILGHFEHARELTAWRELVEHGPPLAPARISSWQRTAAILSVKGGLIQVKGSHCARA